MENATQPYARRWHALGILCSILFIISIDNTVLNLAVPSISKSLGASASELQWIVDAYTLIFAALLITTGSISDHYGRKRLLLIGLSLFGLGSIGAALSTSTNMLIAFRAILGAAGAMMMPSTLSILSDIFRDPGERARAIAMWSSVFTVGAGIGPIIGGVLLNYFNWSSVFYLNIPIVLFAISGTLLYVPESHDERTPSPDFPGVTLSTGGLIALVYSIIKIGESGGFTPEIMISTGAAVLLLGAFIWWENHVENPMLPLEFFKNMSFTGSNLALTLSSFAMMGSIYFFSQFFQSVQGYSPLISALCLFPMTPAGFIFTLLSVRVDRRLGAKRTITLGLLTTGVGLLIFSLTAAVDTPYIYLLISTVILSIGMGFTMSPATNTIMNSLPPSRAGVGSAMNDTTRQIGGALGVAVLGALMNATYRTQVNAMNIISNLPDSLAEMLRSSIQSAHIAAATLTDLDVAQEIVQGSSRAFVSGMRESMMLGFIIMLISALFAYLVIPKQIQIMPANSSSDAGQPQKIAAQQKAS